MLLIILFFNVVDPNIALSIAPFYIFHSDFIERNRKLSYIWTGISKVVSNSVSLYGLSGNYVLVS